MGADRGSFHLSIVGAGPSCTYVLERLAATAPDLPEDVDLRIDIYDRGGHFGAGAVHSTAQPKTSYLNRIVGQVSFAADPSVRGAGRLLDPIRRPTLHEWCRGHFEKSGDPDFDLAPEDWPKRYMHGLALQDRFEEYLDLLRSRPGIAVDLHAAEVIDVIDRGDRLELVTDGPAEPRTADHVLFVTGHSSNDPRHFRRRRDLLEFAEARSSCRYVAAAYPLEERIPAEASGPGSVVACNGMGLTAIDLVLYLTEARGGAFRRGEDERLHYVPCGREPNRIVPFGESGLFTFARPFNGKEQDLDNLTHRPLFLTVDAIDALRDNVGVTAPGGDRSRRQLDFERHIFPVLLLEMACLYYRTLLGPRFGDRARERADADYRRFLAGAGSAGDPQALLAAVERLVDEAVAVIDPVMRGEVEPADALAAAADWDRRAAFARHLEVVFGRVVAAEALDRIEGGEEAAAVLAGLRSPFGHEPLLADKRFSWRAAIEPIDAAAQGSPEDYRQAMLDFFERDHRWAAQGNLDNPAKAAADGVWRDVRQVLAYAVDFGGLTPDSHRAFLETYMRHHNRLANGAGLEVMERMRALAEAGILDVSVGPHGRVEADPQSGRFRVIGGRTGAAIEADTLVEAVVHPFDPERDELPLYPNLLRRGLVRKWRNPGRGKDGEGYEPGGLDLSPQFHPLRPDGEVDARLTLLGPPSEGVMFFQLGALRPNQDHHVMRDILCWLEEFRNQVQAASDRSGDSQRHGVGTVGGAVVENRIRISEELPAAALRRLLGRGPIMRVGGVHDALSALVAEGCGVDALWASGLGIAASHGVPDANILTLGEVRDAARLIAGASSLPVIADCDTGFGEVRNLRRTVAEFEHAGVAAVCIEDKLYPKRNSFGPSGAQKLIDAHEFATKIRAAKDTQRSADLMVVARLESLIAGELVEAALWRAELYTAAGADAIVVHSKAKGPEEVIDFAAAWRGRGHTTPLIAIPTTYNQVSAAELERAGFAMVIYANQTLRAAVGAMEQTMRTIVEQGSSRPIEASIPSVASIFELTGEEEVSRYDEWFAQATEEARRREGSVVQTLPGR